MFFKVVVRGYVFNNIMKCEGLYNFNFEVFNLFVWNFYKVKFISM